jgi:hypothetical protein
MMQMDHERGESIATQSNSRSRLCSVKRLLGSLDEWLTASRLGRLFKLSGSGHVRSISQRSWIKLIFPSAG